MIRNLSLLGAIMALTLAGCGDDSRPSHGDSGIVLMDSGTAMDTGTTVTDSGTTTDTGTADAGGPTGPCANPLMPLPASLLPRCTAATNTCIQGCTPTDGACLQACTDGDHTPAADLGMGQMLDCGGCFNYAVIQCADGSGCHDSIAALQCCLQATGCNPRDPACCPTEQSAFQSCLGGVAASCIATATGDANGCFAAM